MTLVGFLPTLVILTMVASDKISLRRMIHENKQREKKVSNVMDVLGSAMSRQAKLHAVQDMDLTTEYFHGKYHRATLFDIAALTGEDRMCSCSIGHGHVRMMTSPMCKVF